MPDAWSRAADTIQEGWQVTEYDSATGETTGRVVASPEFREGVLRVHVKWDFSRTNRASVLEVPISRRTIRLGEEVVIASAERLWRMREQERAGEDIGPQVVTD